MDAADIDKAVAAGASGFLPKRISAAALGLSLELMALGENLFTAPMRPLASSPRCPANSRRLPSREVSKDAN